MRKVLGFRKTADKAKDKLNILTKTLGFAPRRSYRIRPRDESETEALCRAVIHAVNDAKQSGRLKKTAEGYIVAWKK